MVALPGEVSCECEPLQETRTALRLRSELALPGQVQYVRQCPAELPLGANARGRDPSPDEAVFVPSFGGCGWLITIN
jgi:hypothetical protein